MPSGYPVVLDAFTDRTSRRIGASSPSRDRLKQGQRVFVRGEAGAQSRAEEGEDSSIDGSCLRIRCAMATVPRLMIVPAAHIMGVPVEEAAATFMPVAAVSVAGIAAALRSRWREAHRARRQKTEGRLSR